MNMTKREVREALGFTLDRQLAEFFGVGKAAVSNWPEDEPIPSGRQWQARAKRPDIFESAPARRPTAANGETAEAAPVVLTPKRKRAA